MSKYKNFCIFYRILKKFDIIIFIYKNLGENKNEKVFINGDGYFNIASGSVFGMYGADNTWLFFLIHGNQLRARMNQLGFTLGNGTIKGISVLKLILLLTEAS